MIIGDEGSSSCPRPCSSNLDFSAVIASTMALGVLLLPLGSSISPDLPDCACYDLPKRSCIICTHCCWRVSPLSPCQIPSSNNGPSSSTAATFRQKNNGNFSSRESWTIALEERKEEEAKKSLASVSNPFRLSRSDPDDGGPSVAAVREAAKLDKFLPAPLRILERYKRWHSTDGLNGVTRTKT